MKIRNTTGTFRTTFEIPVSSEKYLFDQSSLWTGSCFTENLGNFFENHAFRTIVNPFGILYNPASIHCSLTRILNRDFYTGEEFAFFNDKYVSFDHHGSFSNVDKQIMTDTINAQITRSYDALTNGSWLFVTFGTAWAFRTVANNKIVANCHKMPSSAFERILLPFDTLVSQWSDLIQKIHKNNGNLKIVFTVSPVRHWRDGAVNNQQSKALLINLVHELTRAFHFVSYFPAYEIMMDDLRDYRFYADDMLHPSPVAVEYIRERFMETYLDNTARDILSDISPVVKASGHTIMNPESDDGKSFIYKQLNVIHWLKEKYPTLSLNVLEEHFKALLHSR